MLPKRQHGWLQKEVEITYNFVNFFSKFYSKLYFIEQYAFCYVSFLTVIKLARFWYAAKYYDVHARTASITYKVSMKWC